MKRSFRLKIDRFLAGNFLKQLVIAFVPFIMVLLIITFFYTRPVGNNKGDTGTFVHNIHKAFVNMTNPETVSIELENPTKGFWAVFWIAFAYFGGAVAFTGLLVATITNIWHTRADRFRRGKVNYRFSKHFVFLGYNELVPGMIQKICEEEDPKHIRIVVGVENNASVVCDKIKNRLYEKYRSCVVVLQADSCNMKDLERLRVPYAQDVYIIGEHDDAYNLKCYRTIYEVSLCERSRKIKIPKCYVNLQSQATLTLFRTYASAGDLGIDFANFNSFSFFDEWSKMIIKEMIEKRWVGNENFQDHFFIAGMTEIGIALARKIALLIYKPSSNNDNNDNNHTIITLIDNDIIKKSRQFIIQHQVFFERCRYSILTREEKQTYRPNNNGEQLDIEFEFIEGDLTEDKIRETFSKSQQDSHQKTTIALCYEDPLLNLTMGLNLPNYEEEGNTRVWVYQPTLGDLGKYLKNSLYKNVVTFGMSGDNLDVRNTECTNKAMLINHFFLHKEDKNDIDFSNQLLIESEWEGTSIANRWICIRHAEFIPYLAQYKTSDYKEAKDYKTEKDDDEDYLNPKMIDLVQKRSTVDNSLFDIEKNSKYLLENNYQNFIKVLQKNIAPKELTNNN